MPVLRHFIVVGLFLIGMLYVADAVLPRSTRLQVTSNFEGIPPAPQRPFNRPVLVPAPELRDVAQSSVNPDTEVEQAPNLRQPEPLRPSTSDPAAASQAGEAPKLGEPELAMSPTVIESRQTIRRAPKFGFTNYTLMGGVERNENKIGSRCLDLAA
jgi:hypothetical protein